MAEAAPPPRPLWKQELNRKLEGYRDRQRLAREIDESGEDGLSPGGEKPGQETAPLASGRHRGVFSETVPMGGLGAARARVPEPEKERPPANRWRRVEKTPSQQPLPPLKPTPASGPARSEAQASLPRPKPASPHPHAEAVASEAPIAPIAIRAIAGLLDIAVVVVALGVFVGVCSLAGGAVVSEEGTVNALGFSFLIILSFYWIFYLRYLGQTNGMTWLGLRVLNFDGQRPSDSQRLTRALGTILSAASLGLGFAWAVADEERLTWHDRMSKTFVTRDASEKTSGFRRVKGAVRPDRTRLPDLKPSRTL
jgi:uncharacterized RDD family membrane protein YckC